MVYQLTKTVSTSSVSSETAATAEPCPMSQHGAAELHELDQAHHHQQELRAALPHVRHQRRRLLRNVDPVESDGARSLSGTSPQLHVKEFYLLKS